MTKILTILAIILLLTGAVLLLETFKGKEITQAQGGSIPYSETWTPINPKDMMTLLGGVGGVYPQGWKIEGSVGEAGSETYYSETWTAVGTHSVSTCYRINPFDADFPIYSGGMGCGYPVSWSVSGNVDTSPPSLPTTETVNTSGSGDFGETCIEWLVRTGQYQAGDTIGAGSPSQAPMTLTNVCVYYDNDGPDFYLLRDINYRVNNYLPTSYGVVYYNQFPFWTKIKKPLP